MKKAKTFGGSAIFMIFLVMSLPICLAAEMNLEYDANGNLMTGDGKYRVYNSLNQLVKVYNGSDDSSALMLEYVYHPVEERVWQKKVYNESGSLEETVYYWSKNFVTVVNSSGSYNFTYIYHEGQLIAQQEPDGSKVYTHGDLKGSSSVVTDEDGNVIERTLYSPTGEIIAGGQTMRYGYEAKEQELGRGSIPTEGLVSYYSMEGGVFDTGSSNPLAVINYTGGCSDLNVSTPYYRMRVSYGGGVDLYYTYLNDSFNWGRGDMGWDQSIGALYTTTWTISAGKTSTKCVITEYPDHINAYYYTDNAANNASNSWNFYKTHIELDSYADLNYHVYHGIKHWYSGQYNIWNGTDNKTGNVSYTDWDSKTGIAGVSFTSDSISPDIYVVDWNESATTDFDYATRTSDSIPGVVIGRWNSIAAGKTTRQKIKVLVRDDSKSFPDNYLTPLEGFRQDTSYGTPSQSFGSSEYGNNGTAINATPVDGKVRQAYKFDGSADYLQVPDGPDSGLDLDDAITISTWVKPARATQGYMVAKYGAYMLQFSGSPNNTTQGGVWISGSWNPLATSWTIPLNQWSHIVFTYNKSNAYIYVNGAQAGYGYNVNTITENDNPLMIGGKLPTDRSRDFNGSIDEVGLWNRALSPSEIKELYDYGSKFQSEYGSLPSDGLVSYYKLDGDGSDETGTNPASSINGATETDGKLREAYGFDGVDDYIAISDSLSVLNVDVGEAKTLSAWIRGGKQDPRGYFLWKEGNCLGWSLRLETNGDLNIRFNTGSGCSGYTSYQETVDDVDYDDDVWHHVVGVIDRPDEEMRLYVDGDLKGTVFVDNSAGAAGGSARIGTDWNNGNPFNGSIDEVGVWNRSLNDDEIKELYHYGRRKGEAYRSTDFNFRKYNPELAMF
ncbi:LamG domain-containing protein, partial [Candidatus Woesearchaeota archaeon]|nr:LamG domain-containing protein [Candidatus Woesearchaeota archaeon]